MINLNNLAQYQYILIDLDNTIYPELSFLKKAYANIARHLEKKYGINQTEAFKFLVTEFISVGRDRLFDKLLDLFNINSKAMPEVLEQLRNTVVKEKIPMFPEAQNILHAANQNHQSVFVVTNGNIKQQKNKVKSIMWAGHDEKLVFVYANLYAPKPSPLSFNVFLKPTFGLFNDGIMIGDSTEDKFYAANIGLNFCLASWGISSRF